MKLFKMFITVLLLLSFAATAQPSEGKGAIGFAGLPPSAQSAVSDAMGKNDPEFHYAKTANGFRADNRRHRLAAQLTDSAVTISNGTDHWTLELASFGRASSLNAVAGVKAETFANRVEYRRGNLTEWYVNGPFGIEQGFTIKDRPQGNYGEKLVLAMKASGLRAVEKGRGDLSLVREDGSEAFSYSGVVAWDADGRSLPVQLALSGQRVLLQCDDRDARYPVTVDPYFQGTFPPANDGVSGDFFGYSVAVSSDGTTALVGAPGDESSQGAAYVFYRSGGTWTQQAKLIASDGVANDNFGFSVSLSGDGSTALVGAYGKESFTGAAYVFTRTESVWDSGVKLTAGIDGESGDYFGSSVSISDDGSMVLIGALHESTSSGAAYVFAGGGASWTRQARLTAFNGAAGDRFGVSVSLDGDGNTALIGAYGKDTFKGAAYLFARGESEWGTGVMINASDGAANDNFGSSVSISDDGSTVLIGALRNASYTGAAYLFTGGGVSWSEQQKLTASDAAAGDRFGVSVSLSSDGNTALIGAYQKNSSSGAAYVFTGGGATLTEQQKLTASDAASSDNFGLSVSLSSNGSTILVGAPFRNSSTGGVYLFDFVLPPTVSKGFAAQSINLNGTTTLTLTISNPNNIAGLSSIALTDNLPAGIVVSSSPNVINDCGGAVSADAGSGTITLSGASLASGGSCVFSVNVTGITPGTWNNITENITSVEGGAGGSASASIVVNAVLSIAFSGSGGGTVKSISPDAAINCIKGSPDNCSANYPLGTSVTLSATPDWKSIFGGWSGGVTGSTSPVTFTLDASKAVTATFNPAPLLQVGTGGYPTLQAAYDSAASGSIIQMLENANVGTLNAQRNVAVTLKGGYDPVYTSNPGTTKVTGPMIVGLGQITLDRVEIR